MSLSKTVYGGFPGPPERRQDGSSQSRQERRQPRGFIPPHGVSNQAEQFQPNVAEFYSNSTAGYLPPDLHYDGRGYETPNLFYPAEFANQPTYFGPNYMMGGSTTYPGTSMPHAFESPGFYADDMTAHFTENQHYQTMLPDNSSAAGKSRRFSRQRNIKESGTSGEMYNPKLTAEDCRPHKNDRRSHQFKQPIRFSHQKENQNGKKPENIKDPGSKNTQAKGMNESKPEEKAPKSFSRTKGKKVEVMKYDGGNQASVLHEQLSSGTYECMVCCDRVRPPQAVWSCMICYNVFHMGCIKKWARSPAAKVGGTEDSGWRCPGCQNVSAKIPASYLCFCGKVKEPEYKKGEMPHSCGDLCGKARRNNPDCTHPCNILCHPGPCPQCPAMVTRRCKCGKISSRVRCSQQKSLACNEVCGKNKNCSNHSCDVVCHSGDCDPCHVKIKQACYCGLEDREVGCGSEEHRSQPTDTENGCYSCTNICNRLLSCGNHNCSSVCHPGPCKPCSLLPSLVTRCPCSQTKLSNMQMDDGGEINRKSCLDPVPTCDKICGKPLLCGGEDVHVCKQLCHTGPCSPCPDGESTIVCRCRKSEKDVPCMEFVEIDSYVCDRRCNKKRKCGKHKCGQMCCTDTEHNCLQLCGRKLTCGNHRCDETCHRGACHTCYNVSFDELRCFCNDKVIFPPIPCGMKAPECNKICSRMHPCTHPVRHSCHTEEHCPPCVELVKKTCNCGRTIRGNIMCHIDNVSCGAPCFKVLACGHKCLRPCHKGMCIEDVEPCKQPCSIMRVECIHPCANPCHHGTACPTTPCKAMVTMKCECSRREEQVVCSAGGAIYQSVSSAAFASKQDGVINIDKILQTSGLPCDEECSVAARNKRFADALNITDAEYGSRPKQQYSEFLINMAKSDLAFIRTVEKDLINLVESVGWLDVTKQSHTFPVMRREKRQAVHELADAFQCRSESLDIEPNRSVVATATKSVSKQPTPLLSDVIMEQVTSEKVYSSSKQAQSKGVTHVLRVSGDESSASIRVERILHPSPASPQANSGWEEIVLQQLRNCGVLQILELP